MVKFNPLNLFKAHRTRLNNVAAPAQEGIKKAEKAKETQAATTDFTIDMSELEVKAEMNKALGFTSSTDAVRMERADREFAKDPIAFANKYLSSEVRANTEMAAVDLDYEVLANYGDNQLAKLGTQEFVKANLHGTPKEVAQNFINTGILDEIDKNIAYNAA